MPISNIMIKPNNTIINLKIWYNCMSPFLFQYKNPYSSNFAGHASLLSCPITEFFKSCCSHNSCEGFGYASTNPLSLNWSWYWETFIQSSCQNVQFLRSKKDKNVINVWFLWKSQSSLVISYPKGGGSYSSMIWVWTCRWDLKSRSISYQNFPKMRPIFIPEQQILSKIY